MDTRSPQVCTELMNAVSADGLVDVRNGTPLPEQHKVAVVAHMWASIVRAGRGCAEQGFTRVMDWPDNHELCCTVDYHFYRQNRGGLWSEKSGESPVKGPYIDVPTQEDFYLQETKDEYSDGRSNMWLYGYQICGYVHSYQGRLLPQTC